MAVNYGQVAIVPKGEWNVETQYKVNNLVSYDGSSYVAKVQPPVGTLPTDTSYWQVSAVGTKKATADSLGTVMPDGTTTSVGEDGKLSVNTAQQDALGVVKGSDDITVGEDGTLTVNTTFKQATELANIIAGEAIKSVLGKVSKAIATTMNLDENALLKNMISGIDVNDGSKVPSSAYIHSLVERIGMGTALEGGFDNLTAGLNSVNNNLSKKLFVKIGDTSNGNHSQIDQIADFYGITWVNSNYNSTFGGQWCFIDSTIVDNSGPYAMQRIMSCENAAVLATRYCTKGTWGAWNVGVTKSEIKVTNYFDRIKPDSAYINGYNNNEQCVKLIEISDNIKIVNINLAVKTKALNKIEAQIIELPAQIRPQKNVVFTAYANKEPAFAYYSSGKIMFIYNKALTENAEIDIIASYLI